MSIKKPNQVKVNIYNVGFGDCFLLTFKYSDQKAVKILIDCGTSSETKEHMKKVVDKLIKDCDSNIDALVITHRHKDHLSAFNDNMLGKKLEELNPKIVIQPWTEHPEAEDKAIEAPGVFSKNAIRQIYRLNNFQQISQRITNNPERILFGAGPRITKEVLNLAELNVPNKVAVNRLARMGKQKAFVYAGSKTGLEKMLPGVKIMVLGPPTLKQSPEVKKQKSWDEDEFWKFYMQLQAVSSKNVSPKKGSSILFPKAETLPVSKLPSYNKWLVKKIDNIQLHNIRQLVRIMDKALNNTSIILLFKIGNKALLFPGDAQLENWNYALNDKKIKNELKNVVLYKVGHHGSTNATPKTMWNLIPKGEKLTTLLSTKSGKHAGVPQKTLVETLVKKSTLVNTQKFAKKLGVEIII